MNATTSLLTTKRVADLGPMTLAKGGHLAEVRLGYETYGELNARRDNTVLVCHFFSGSSHAAGRYTDADVLPGWWDPVIGAGKAIDTERWFVVAVDALGCLRLDSPHGVTTSPASIDPATGEPYGQTFPEISVADMVESQYRLLQQLGVERLAAVAGPSMGAMQALEWAVRRPLEVDRVIAAIGLAAMQPREQGLYVAMEDAIRLDPAFADGRYKPGTSLPGLQIAVKLMYMLSGGHQVPGAPEPAEFREWLARETALRASVCDANSMITLLRTNASWRLGDLPLAEAVRRIRARVLLLPGRDDRLLPADVYNDPIAEALGAQGAELRVQPLPAGLGHLAGLGAIAHGARAIQTCLETPLW